MRHLKSGRKLNRSASHRWALMRNLVTSLLRDERIRTTDPKAKELRRWADRVISLGKEGTLHARRQALGIVQDKSVVRKLFDSLAARFKDRPGGYTRIVKIGWRHGDSAPISLVELVGETAKAESPSGAKKAGRQRRRSTAAQEGGAKKKATRKRAAKESAA
jgi:large subunit ribosomal protein L17